MHSTIFHGAVGVVMHVYKYGVHGEKAVVGIVMNVMNRLTKIKEVK